MWNNLPHTWAEPSDGSPDRRGHGGKEGLPFVQLALALASELIHPVAAAANSFTVTRSHVSRLVSLTEDQQLPDTLWVFCDRLGLLSTQPQGPSN